MSLKPSVRNYLFEDATLIQEAGRIKNAVSRDNKEFAKRNITNGTLTDFQTKIDAFDDFPTDEELQGVVVDATANKDALAQNIRVQARTIRNMAELQYHKTGSYKTFGFEGMDEMSDANLYRLAKRVVRVGTKLLPVLSKQGLTQEILDTLAQIAVDFDKAMDTQESEIENRDLQTQERIRLGNDLYAVLVQLASIGKSLYQDTDAAKYNDYVLYHENTKPKEETVAGA